MFSLEVLDYGFQTAITITGFFSLYFLASQEASVRMKAGIIGLIGEPFWFSTALINEQYAILPLVLVYGINWIRVVHSNYTQVQNEKMNRISI